MKIRKTNGTLSMGQNSKFPAIALGLSLAMAASTMGADFSWADESADNSSWNGVALNTNVEFEFEEIGKAGTTTLELFDGGILTGGALKLQRNDDGDEAGESIINVGNGVGESILTLYQLQLGKADDGTDVDRTATVNIAEGGTLIIDQTGPWGTQGVWMAGEDSSFNLFGDGKLSVNNANTTSGLDVDRVFGTDGNNNAAGGVDIFDDGTFTHYTAATASTADPEIISIAVLGNGDVVLTTDVPAAGLTAQQSEDLTLTSFANVDSTVTGANELTIASGDVDPNADGADFYRVW